ncbi:MAG: ATP-dependent protease ATPase subunit HslU [Bacteroidota bacterium]|jgi:ATP-dependent HslUV protease ATP-binding subunit HslU
MLDEKYLTPQQIVAELDKYIIGQHEAKRNVAIALRNRWRRMATENEIQKDISPNNILMIGATGVGKTEIARRLAKLADAPFIKVEASKFTEVGYVGRDVESMVRDLIEVSIKMVKDRLKEDLKSKATELVDEHILDILIPPLKKSGDSAYTGIDIKPEAGSDEELNEKTRDKFREKLKRGDLDDKKIEIDVKQSSSVNVVGPIGIDDSSMQNLQEMLGGMMPKNAKKRKVTIADARKILLDDEVSKMIDMDEVKEEAIKKAENTGIIFIDEIDKIARSKNGSGGGEVSRDGVQRDLLPIVEGSAVNTKYGVVNTDHVLFIAAGAFHFSKPTDLIPELQGRFPIRVELDKLTKNDFVQILQSPKNALTKQYQALLGSEGVEISFTEGAIDKLAEIAFFANNEMENIGARRLQTVMSQLLNEFMFDVPEKIAPNTHIEITADLVQEKLGKILANKDLSEYIL